MAYTTRTVKSSKGLSQEKALLTLQQHPEFVPGTKIASIYNQGGVWVAKLLEPKTAAEAFEEIEEDVKESPAELHDEKHEEEESPFEEIEEHKDHDKHEKDEDKKLKELEKKLDLLLDALGISEKGEGPDSLDKDLEGPEGPMADAPAAPSKDKGPKSDPLPPGSGAKLKPGEVPNKPGMTPVGSPAFASVKQATDGSANASNAGDMAAPGTPSSSGPVTQNPLSDEEQARRQMQTGTPSVGTQNIVSFVASKLDPNHEITIRQAKASIENELTQVKQNQNFRVAKIRRDGDFIRAFVTRNDS